MNILRIINESCLWCFYLRLNFLTQLNSIDCKEQEQRRNKMKGGVEERWGARTPRELISRSEWSPQEI
jgi:hypothetical protein